MIVYMSYIITISRFIYWLNIKKYAICHGGSRTNHTGFSTRAFYHTFEHVMEVYVHKGSGALKVIKGYNRKICLEEPKAAYHVFSYYVGPYSCSEHTGCMGMNRNLLLGHDALFPVTK